MVTALIKKSSEGYISFECKGHSGYADHGNDIVCAAISMLTINTANSIMTLTNTKIVPINDDGFLSWDFSNKPDNEATLLMDSLVLGLQTIEDTYTNKYLTLIIEEV